jgi:hypothetical protein
MKVRLIAFSILFLFWRQTIAQDLRLQLEKVSKADLLLKDCPFEKGVGAMNLVKTAKITFGYNNLTDVPRIETEYIVRIKIFNSLGFTAANIKIPYVANSRYSNIKDLEAYIYSINAAGNITKTKVAKKDIYTGKSGEKESFSYISFTFPDLSPGAVIEYKYTRVDKNSRFLVPWFFQDLLPTAFSKVTAIVPTYLNMDYYVLAGDSVERYTFYRQYEGGLYNEDTHSYAMHNIRAFKEEPLMTSVKDNLERVEFSLSIRTWFSANGGSPAEKMRFLNYHLLNSHYVGWQFDWPLPKTVHFTDSVSHLSKAADKVAAIYNYVKANVTWNGEQTFFCSDSISGCLNAKSGNSADMNILLLNLLRKAGVNCLPVLVSTRENGSPDINFGSISQFNGIDILVIDSAYRYILDCTQKELSYKMPPFNVLNSYGYIVDNAKMGWLLLMNRNLLMKKEIDLHAEMNSSGLVKGTATFLFIDFAKTEALKELKEDNEKKAGDKNDELDNTPSLVIDSSRMEPSDDRQDTLTQKIAFHFTPSSSDKFYFLNPFIFSFFNKNPFIENERFSDVNFGSNQSISVQAHIKIPPDFSLETIPDNIYLKKNDSTISFERKIYTENNYLIIKNILVIRQAVFIKEDYPDLKLFFDKFYGLLNQQIVLKRKD